MSSAFLFPKFYQLFLFFCQVFCQGFIFCHESKLWVPTLKHPVPPLCVCVRAKKIPPLETLPPHHHTADHHHHKNKKQKNKKTFFFLRWKIKKINFVFFFPDFFQRPTDQPTNNQRSTARFYFFCQVFLFDQ